MTAHDVKGLSMAPAGKPQIEWDEQSRSYLASMDVQIDELARVQEEHFSSSTHGS